MSLTHPSLFLHRALLADAAISGATGLLMLLGAGLLEQLLGVPAALMRYAGLALLPFSALVGYLAMRDSLARPAVWAIIACNVLWAADCLLLLLSGWLDPTALGHAFIILQALVVALFAELQYLGLQRSVPAAA